jgi:hypothetical protein
MAALACAVVGACQVVTGLSSLELVDADVVGSSRTPNARADADAGEDGETVQPEADGGMRCRPPHGLVCDVVTQCGCAQDQHCQALGAQLEPSCVSPGALEPGSACSDSANCPRGQACDDGVCRAYCKVDADCKGGRCVAGHVSDASAASSSRVNVCWIKCQVGRQGACGPGATCRALQPDGGSKANYCAAPADPCPTAENGRCDDSRGTGACADGSDQRDCECQPKLPEASCDLIEQCGCAKGSACIPVFGMAGGYSAKCVPWSGTKQTGEACQRAEDCAAGQLCRTGRCARLCDSDDQCAGGKCASTELASSPEAQIETCYQTCARDDPSSCSDGTRCAHFDERFKVPGDFCVQPRAPCFEPDRVCDEPAGSGICAPDTEPIDCCKPSVAGGECNLVLQCGCEAKPGTSCVESPLASGGRTTACRAPGPTDVDNWCGEDSDCRAGAGCFGNICRKYCDTDKDCRAGGRCVLGARKNVTSTLKACLGPCDPTSDVPCGSNTKCRAGTIEDAAATGCTLVPLTTSCPKQNGRCDEPEGTGLCEQGNDAAECSSVPK